MPPAARAGAQRTEPSALAPLAALRGSAKLTLADSMLAGVPLAGSASLRHAEPAALQAALQLEAGGNRLTLAARLDGHGDGHDDQWDLSASAPRLARLAPLLRLTGIEGLGELGGALDADAHLSGRWPHVASQGHASAEQLQSGAAGGLGIARGALRWQLGSAADAPAALNLQLTQTRIGRLQIDKLLGQLEGSAAAHRLTLHAEAKGGPPAWTDAVSAANTTSRPAVAAAPSTAQAPVAAPASAPAPAPASASASASAPPPAPAPAPTRTSAAPSAPLSSSHRGTSKASTPRPSAHTLLTLQAQGGLDTGAAPRWHGTLQQLELRSSEAARAPWAVLRDVGLDVELAGDTTPAQARIAAGRAQLLGATVRWDPVTWQGASAAAPARIDLHAEVDPLPVAPLLRQLQPEFGWGGDLRVGASVSLRSAPQFSADVVLQRQSGDLSVTEDTRTQSLGLSDMRLALNADNGLWDFTAALAGSRLGAGAAAVTVRTSPDQLWPPAQSAIQGVLEASVTDLGSWGTWVPPGWRLSGRIHTSASIAGRFGAPELTGVMTGSGIGARNVIEGVDVSDGELQISLQGETARIERLLLHGGKGTLQLAGTVDLGSGLAPASANAAVAPLHADLTLDAKQFQLLGRVDRRIVTSGQGRLVVDGNRLALDGRFGVDEGLIDFTRSDAPSLSDDVVVTRGADQPNPNAAATEPGASPYSVALDLTVGLGEHLRLRGRGLDTELRGELKLTSPGGQLAVNGNVNTVHGTYAAYNQKLEIDRGVISFAGPIANPRLDIQATRPDLDVRVGVAITGFAVDPRIRLFSEPDMSDIDKLSYLMLGRASDGLGGNDVALLQQAALALLSGEGQSPSSSFTKALGLDSLSLSQGQSGDLRDTVVSLGKQISRRWYVGYAQGLNATAGSLQLIYRLARRFTLRAQSGTDSSIDVIWTWRWQ